MNDTEIVAELSDAQLKREIERISKLLSESRNSLHTLLREAASRESFKTGEENV